MKGLTKALVGLLFACGVCAEAAGSQCQGNLVQHTSIREVVVWVNENGQRIDPNAVDQSHIEEAPAPQKNLAANDPPHEPSISIPNTEGSRVASTTSTSKEDEDTNDHSITSHDTKNWAPPPPPAPPQVPHPQVPHPQLPHPQLPHPQVPHPPKPAVPHPHPPPHGHPQRHGQFGISYSPYKADRSCKNQEEVNEDLDQLSQYTFIRIYGTDCDQTKTVANAARRNNMRVFAGLYDLTGFPGSLSAISDVAKGPDGNPDWSVFHTIAIGNELVNGGTSDPAEVVSAVEQARSILRGQGYKGPVVTVDTFSVLLDYPELCAASDYCAANCHAFFDAHQKPGGAGAYALEQARAISSLAGGKRTMITESGWPHAGDANGAAVPSPDNQQTAIASLKKSFDHRREDLVLFTAFDDLWKDDNRFTFNAEKFWGIHGGL